jgi:DNA-binding transcriptional MerR regulator
MSGSSCGSEDPSRARTMRIGELSARTAVSPRSLRYYDQQRLLDARRNSGGQRTYDISAVDRVTLIQEFFAAGLCSTRIRSLLACLDAGGANASIELGCQLSDELDRLDAQLKSVAEARSNLDELRRRLSTPV